MLYIELAVEVINKTSSGPFTDRKQVYNNNF